MADQIYGNYEDYVNSLRYQAKAGDPVEYVAMTDGTRIVGNANSNVSGIARALRESAQSAKNSVGGNGVGELGGVSAKQMSSGWKSTRKATDLKSVMSRVMKALK